MASLNSSHLNEPLYRYIRSKSTSPPPKGKSDHYLPPYRYDDNETAFNKFLSSDEAYSTVAKALLYEFENNVGNFKPYDIILRTLTISQIKMFADAHMEKALVLPTFPARFESPNVTLLRKIDSIFGSVLLEFFASKDGILLGPQVEMLTKIKSSVCEEMNRNTKNDCNHSKEKNFSVKTYNNELNDFTSISSPSRQSIPTKHGNDAQKTKGKEAVNDSSELSILQIEETKVSSESTFDRIYMHEVEIDNLLSIEKTESCNLKKEIINEIDRLKLEIQKTDSQDEKQKYTIHLKSLVEKLDKFTNKNQTADEDLSQVFERYRVLSNDKVDEEEPPLSQPRVKHDESFNTKSTTSRSIQAPVDLDENAKRGIFTISSSDKTMQSKGFVHIRDMERGFKLVKVVAHGNFKDGVLFQAKYRGRYFTVRVPQGGVREGDVFTSPMLHPSGQTDEVVHYECLLDGMEVPEGQWRDRLFQCCNDPILSMSCLCPNAALSQIRSRLQFQDSGEVTCESKVRSLVCFNLLILFLNMWTILALVILLDEVHLWLVIACWVPLGLIDAYLLFKFVALTLKTRREVKERYKIRNEYEMSGAIEVTLVTCCSCCVISQMGRHTADYKTFREEYLSATGLPPNLELLVPLGSNKRKYCSPEDVQHDSFHIC